MDCSLRPVLAHALFTVYQFPEFRFLFKIPGKFVKLQKLIENGINLRKIQNKFP
jgi:hypothetical protein